MGWFFFCLVFLPEHPLKLGKKTVIKVCVCQKNRQKCVFFFRNQLFFCSYFAVGRFQCELYDDSVHVELQVVFGRLDHQQETCFNY